MITHTHARTHKHTHAQIYEYKHKYSRDNNVRYKAYEGSDGQD